MEKTKIIDEITVYIKSQILNGTYKNNERISERTISQKFNVSRTIVRQAFLMLKNSHWLYSKTKSGTYVASVDHQEVIENYEARIVLEPHILMNAHPNLSEKDIEELHNTIKAIIESSSEDYHILEPKLHMIIVRRTNNRYITMFMESMIETMERVAALSSRAAERRPTSIHEWMRIVESLEKKDPLGASIWLSRHLLNSFENFKKNN